MKWTLKTSATYFCVGQAVDSAKGGLRRLYPDIIYNYDQLAELLQSDHKGEKVVCTIGSWDMLHVGHVRYLQAARNMGDILVVGVDSDNAYRLYKGKEPVYPEGDRMKIVAALRCVDYATMVRDVDPNGEWQMGLVKVIHPDLFICSEKTYPPEQRMQIKRFCPIEILSFHDQWTSLSAGRSDAARDAYRLYLDRLTLEDVVHLIQSKLRAALHTLPENEKQVQNEIETILNVRGIDFEREKERVGYSSKAYQPDFTLPLLNVALEVKFCSGPNRERELVDEINADIIGYKKKFSQVLFVVYDKGAIRDVKRFTRDFEEDSSVHVIVVKQ